MVYFRLNSYRSLARFLSNHPDTAYACGLSRYSPSYRTLSRRLKTLDDVLWSFIYQIIAVLVRYHLVSLNIVTTDSSLLEAKGKPRQKKDPNIIPADKDAMWGWSESRQFVFGYKIHLTSTVLIGGKTLIPLSWNVTAANVHDSKQFIPLMIKTYGLTKSLKRRIYLSLGDKGYDQKINYSWCNTNKMKLVTPVRRFTKQAISKIKTWSMRFVESIKGKLLYRRRSDNERLFSQIKDIFLIDPLPIVGIEAVSSYLSVVCLSYLLGILYNHLNGRTLRAIKSLVA